MRAAVSLKARLPSLRFAPKWFSSDPKVARSEIDSVLDEAAKVLPNQAILENFVHQNPLAAFENMPFREAIDHVHHLEAYMSPAERLSVLLEVDPRKRANEALADLSSSFLDRGAAKWTPQFRDRGFLFFFATLEGLGLAPWRKFARQEAVRVLAEIDKDPDGLSERIIRETLDFYGIPREERGSAVRSTLLDLRGWAGMFRRMELRPNEQPKDTLVRLVDFCAVQMIITRSSMLALALQSGFKPQTQSFASFLKDVPKLRKDADEKSVHPSSIAFVDQTSERREQLEQEFEKMLISAVGSSRMQPVEGRPKMQFVTCIDDREGSFRRHVEKLDPSIETFGVAGFFGLPLLYKDSDGHDPTVLAPDGAKPQGELKEDEVASQHDEMVRYKRRRRAVTKVWAWWERMSFSPWGSLLLSTTLPLSLTRIMLMGFSPSLSRRVSEGLKNTFLRRPGTDFRLPFPADRAAAMLAKTFLDIGIHRNFAPVVLVIGHGSSSVNNPFAAAYNCGACGGREGGPNARVLAREANDPEVRASLERQFGIVIPDDTVFVGAVHNTTAETVEFFDTDKLNPDQLVQFEAARKVIEQARGLNALERVKRFFLASKSVDSPEEALEYVQARSADAAEVRPELNHATNAAVVVGRRKLTKDAFLDRRVFLPSYDPRGDDEEGTNLEHVLAPALVVCSGINLEYLFSTIDIHHAAGTKAPLNVVGNVGVIQGTSGDLRPGLPSQMTEMHTPIRALFVVDAPISRVEAVLKRRPDLEKLVKNEWVRFIVRDVDSKMFFRRTATLNEANEGVLKHYEKVEMGDGADARKLIEAPFIRQQAHAVKVTRKEAYIYWAASAGAVLSCVAPIAMFGVSAMNPYGLQIATCGTLLVLPLLGFARRYLHGEFMFSRFSMLSVAMGFGFNLVALAPTLEHALAGWSLFGFASTFLIGAYNDRPTVRNNATYAFAAYQLSDMALIAAVAFSQPHVSWYNLQIETEESMVAAALMFAALFKSSQLPLTSLFVRSMEGPTPASALGYAGLSAHVGVVLLSSTMPLWMEFDWARYAVAGVGLSTALFSSLVARILPDRKGAIANATSGTIGLIYVILSLGYDHVALLLSFGHASFRIAQILRSPNVISDSQNMRAGLAGEIPFPKIVPAWLYRLGWALRRIHSDFHLIHVLHLVSRRVHDQKAWKLSKWQQFAVTFAFLVLAGAPFLPLAHAKDEAIIYLLEVNPALALVAMLVSVGVSVVAVRVLLVKVLTRKRFAITPMKEIKNLLKK